MSIIIKIIKSVSVWCRFADLRIKFLPYWNFEEVRRQNYEKSNGEIGASRASSGSNSLIQQCILSKIYFPAARNGTSALSPPSIETGCLMEKFFLDCSSPQIDMVS